MTTLFSARTHNKRRVVTQAFSEGEMIQMKSQVTGLTFLFLRKITLMASVDTTMLTFFFLIFFSLNSYCKEVRGDVEIPLHGWPEKLIQTKQIIMLLWAAITENHTAPAEPELFTQDKW